MCRFSRLFLCVTSVIISVSAQESLRFYADKIGLDIGVAMGRQFDNNNETHNNLVKKEFNTVVAENSMKAQSIHPSRGSTNFGGPDKLVKFAQNNKMKVRGHTLVWHNQNAGWICTGSRQASLSNMKYHIETVVGHFKGKIFQWDVVNEAFEDAGGALRSTVWTNSIGNDFIDSAFVYARAADPAAKLYYNDFSTSMINAKSTAVYNMVKEMIEKGIPIDGVGFQCHQSANDVNEDFKKNVKDNFKRFAALGIDIAITELDAKGDISAQAKVFSTYMEIALEMPQVKTYIVWGVRDQDSWISPTPLLFNNNWEPKPAYTAILTLLKTPHVGVVDHSGQMLLSSESGLRFNRVGNSLVLSNVSPTATVVELFDLLGKRTVTIALPASASLPISSLKKTDGVAIVRAGNQAVRIGGLNSW